jgi:glycine C-acetyltransferase
LLGEQDCIISDSLNHASIIDGVRLCKAARYRYENSNMEDLEQQLIQTAAGSRFKLIVTDGVFSMDGLVAPLDKICDLADKYDALVMVDECHAAGFIATGKGTQKQRGDGTCRYYNGNIRKALGGAMEVIPRQKRNYRDLETAFKTVFIFEFAGSLWKV